MYIHIFVCGLLIMYGTWNAAPTLARYQAVPAVVSWVMFTHLVGCIHRRFNHSPSYTKLG